MGVLMKRAQTHSSSISTHDEESRQISAHKQGSTWTESTWATQTDRVPHNARIHTKAQYHCSRVSTTTYRHQNHAADRARSTSLLQVTQHTAQTKITTTRRGNTHTEVTTAGHHTPNSHRCECTARTATTGRQKPRIPSIPFKIYRLRPKPAD